MIRSAPSISLGLKAYCTSSPSIASNIWKSVKLEIRGRRTMRNLNSPSPPLRTDNRPARLSSSSTSTFAYGITPTTGFFTSCSIISIPGSRIVLSPRNLLIISPFMRALSSSSKSTNVPASCAKTPPLSISPTRRTGASRSLAKPILTISFFFKLISAGLPAPSTTTISYSLSSS